MSWIYAAALFAINTTGLLLVVLGLPGTWLMLAASTAVSWLTGRSGPPLISVPVLIALAILALLGEVLELAAGAAGSRRAGGSWRGSVGALGGGLVGGIVGTFAIPIPVAGSILGACAGAFGGALVGELSGGRDVERAIAVGRSAFAGRLVGTLLKLGVGLAMWVTATVASVVP